MMNPASNMIVLLLMVLLLWGGGLEDDTPADDHRKLLEHDHPQKYLKTHLQSRSKMNHGKIRTFPGRDPPLGGTGSVQSRGASKNFQASSDHLESTFASPGTLSAVYSLNPPAEPILKSGSIESWTNYVNRRKVYHFRNSDEWLLQGSPKRKDFIQNIVYRLHAPSGTTDGILLHRHPKLDKVDEINSSQSSTFQEFQRCFGKACGNMQFTLSVDSKALEAFSAILSVPFFPILKHVSKLQSKLSSSYPYFYYSRNDSSLLKIMVFTVLVSDDPLPEVHRFNQQQYCQFHGYDYVHLWVPTHTYRQRYGMLPTGWLSVEFAQELLTNHTDIDYLFKMDLYCVFSRQDIRLETILHPMEHFSIYASHIQEDSRLISSKTWLIKNDKFAKEFLSKWLEYRTTPACKNINHEQGALLMTIGQSLSDHYNHSMNLDILSNATTLTEFKCGHSCHISQSTYQRIHCVLNWMDDNGFGMSGYLYHPKIYIYPYFEDMGGQAGSSSDRQIHFISPMDGFLLHLKMEMLNDKTSTLKIKRSSIRSSGGSHQSFSNDGDYYQRKGWVTFPSGSGINHKYKSKPSALFQPLTVYPCQKNRYLSPIEVMKNLKVCFA